jgi:hypothetical protein
MGRLFADDDDAIVRIHEQLAYLAAIDQRFHAHTARTLTREQIATLIERAFWASIQTNEGRPTTLCVAVVPRDHAPDALRFAEPVPYDEAQLVKLAPTVPVDGCLAVDLSGDEFRIWGISRTIPRFGMDRLTIEAFEPGTVRVGLGPFDAFAVFSGRSVSLIEGTRLRLSAYLDSVLGNDFGTGDEFFDTHARQWNCLALAALARLVVEDGHGGCLLVGPSSEDRWQGELDPFPFRLDRPDTSIRDWIHRSLRQMTGAGGAVHEVSTQATLTDATKSLVLAALRAESWNPREHVRFAAHVARVDGAVVMTRDLQLVGFGAKIAARSSPDSICMVRPEPGTRPMVESPLEALGGTRHQSAARLVYSVKDAVALVISQDRHLSVMHWDPQLERVVIVRNTEWWG